MERKNQSLLGQYKLHEPIDIPRSNEDRYFEKINDTKTDTYYYVYYRDEQQYPDGNLCRKLLKDLILCFHAGAKVRFVLGSVLPMDQGN